MTIESSLSLSLSQPEKFKEMCETFDKENLQPEAVNAVQVYVTNPEFDPDKVKTKSKAAGGLCSYVINILAFWDVFKVSLSRLRIYSSLYNGIIVNAAGSAYDCTV